MQVIRDIISLLRPAQWAKNVIVLAGLIFSKSLGHPQSVRRAGLAFAIFCLLSAAGYAFNDLWDLEQDRRHPEKCKRPLASGRLAPWLAVLACVATLLAGFALAGWLAWMVGGRDGWAFLAIAAGYVAVTFAYTAYLKHVVILDVMAIAGCFLLRAAGGAAALPVFMSSWLFACTLLLALFIAVGKRRAELQLLKDDAVNHRRVIAEYPPKLLDQMIAIVTGATLISYVLYTMWPDTVERFGSDNLKYTVPFVLYGAFRYLYLIYRHDEGGQPELSLFGDAPMLINLALYAVAVFAIVYLPKLLPT